MGLNWLSVGATLASAGVGVLLMQQYIVFSQVLQAPDLPKLLVDWTTGDAQNKFFQVHVHVHVYAWLYTHAVRSSWQTPVPLLQEAVRDCDLAPS